MSSSKHFDVMAHRSPGQHIRQYARATSDSEEDELFLSVKQYVPKTSEQHGNSTGITLVACHANGIPKELYEPLWDALYEYMSKTGKTHISSIWIADVANQNHSSVINEGKLGNDPSWYDHARDYLAMINRFRKDMKQPIVAFGHSMGGNVIINTALMHPRLFATVMTFEPVILKNPHQTTSLAAYPITFRRDQWPSREAALNSFHKHPTYKTWTPEVLKLFIEYGLRDLPTLLYPNVPKDAPQSVTLTTTKYQEALSFLRAAYPPDRSTPLSEWVPTQTKYPDIGDANWRDLNDPFYRPEMTHTFSQIPYLRPSCLFLYGKNTMLMPAKFKRAEKTSTCGTGLGGSGGVAAGRVEERELEGGGHYFPLEKPVMLADDVLGPWLDKEIGRWIEETRVEKKAWETAEKPKRSQYDQDWEWWMKKVNPMKPTKPMRAKI